MSARTAFWSIVLACGLALWGYLFTGAAPDVDLSTMEIESRDSTRADRLLRWPLARLTAIEFGSPASMPRVERDGTAWRYADVVATGVAAAAPADVSAFIDQHLNMFGAARIERSFTAAPAAFADYGISSSGQGIQLYVDRQARPACTLRIGKRTPDSFGQYVLIEPEQRVVIVPAYHIDNLAALAAGPQPVP